MGNIGSSGLDIHINAGDLDLGSIDLSGGLDFDLEGCLDGLDGGAEVALGVINAGLELLGGSDTYVAVEEVPEPEFQWCHAPLKQFPGATCRADEMNDRESLTECKQICMEDDGCFSIDWNHSANPWANCRCWLHMEPELDLTYHRKNRPLLQVSCISSTTQYLQTR